MSATKQQPLSNAARGLERHADLQNPAGPLLTHRGTPLKPPPKRTAKKIAKRRKEKG